MTVKKYSNGHYFEAVTNNVTWSQALDLASRASYRGLQGYLVTITSSGENDFVHSSVVNPSAITGWGSFAGYQGTWIGGSDSEFEGVWRWMSGPEKGTIFANSSSPKSVSAAQGQFSDFLSSVHEGSSRVNFDYAVSQVPAVGKTVPAGWVNELFWDDVPENIGSAEVVEYGPAEYGVGNGYVIEYGGLPSSVRIISGTASVSEGSRLQIEFITTNIEWGKTIDFVINGVSSADISGTALSGSLVVSEHGLNGKAVLSLDISADSLTEGNETFTVTAGGQSASVTVLDTSPTPPTVKKWEGNPLTGAITGSDGNDSYLGGAAGTHPYGIDSLKLIDLKGDAVVNARMSVDSYNPYFCAAVRNSTFEFGNGSVVFDARSKWGHYADGISGSLLKFGDGSSTTTIVVEGQPIYGANGINNSTLQLGGGADSVDVKIIWDTNSWTQFGVINSTVDMGSGNDSLKVSLVNKQISLESWCLFNTKLDLGTGSDIAEFSGVNGISGGEILTGDGDDTIRVISQHTSLKGGSIKTGAGNDSVFLTPSVASALAIDGSSIELGDGDDGLQITRGTGTIDGGYGTDTLTLSGVAADFLIESKENSSIVISSKLDRFTNLSVTRIEFLKFSDKAIEIGKDLPVNSIPSYVLSSVSTSADEGGTATFTLSTTNVAAGTSVPYTITGVSVSDVVGGQLSGAVNVGTNGQATISVPLVADLFTEGPETLTVTAGGQSASVTVIDTYPSPQIPTYSLSASSESVAEGGVAIFNLATTNIAAGNSVKYLISGVSEADVVGNLLSGAVTIDNNGRATISVPMSADNLTEGTETLRIIVSDKAATMAVADTSTSPVYYQPIFIGDLKIYNTTITNDVKVVVSKIGDITRIEGNQENNTLVGTDAIDRLVGGGGSDRFYSSKGNDVLDGGDGTDAVTFNGKSSDFRIEKSGSNWVVRDTRPDTSINQGEDTLTGVDRVAFQDKVLALDTEGTAGKAYRVYKAAFNRDPMQGDTSGLGYWIGQMDSAMDLIEVSARFVDSKEFRDLYGTNPTNAQFLTKLYQNVLGRAPEATGYNWWLNELNTNPSKTKAKVLADFSESGENQTGVASLIGTGITYEPWMESKPISFPN
jgi:Ca2+-binding RTX toxin-like protein